MRRWGWVWLVFFLGVVGCIRFAIATSSPLANDELSALTRADQYSTWPEQFQKGIIGEDVHPPLGQAVVWATASFYDFELELRFPFLLAGGVALTLLCFALYTVWGLGPALVGVGFLGGTYYSLWLGAMARPYAFAMLGLALAFSGLLRWGWAGKTRTGPWMVGLGWLMALYSHYTAAIIAACMGLFMLWQAFTTQRFRIRRVVGFNALVALLALPMVWMAWRQAVLSEGGLTWTSPPGWERASELLLTFTNGSALLLGGVALLVLGVRSLKVAPRQDGAWWRLAVAPLLVTYVVSWVVFPIVHEYPMHLLQWPVAVALAASWPQKHPIGTFTAAGLAVVMITVAVVPLVSQPKGQRLPYGDFRSAVKYLRHESTAGSPDMVSFADVNRLPYLRYYDRDSALKLVGPYESMASTYKALHETARTVQPVQQVSVHNLPPKSFTPLLEVLYPKRRSAAQGFAWRAQTLAPDAARLARFTARPNDTTWIPFPIGSRWAGIQEIPTQAAFQPNGLLFAEAELDTASGLSSWYFVVAGEGDTRVYHQLNLAAFAPSAGHSAGHTAGHSAGHTDSTVWVANWIRLPEQLKAGTRLKAYFWCPNENAPLCLRNQRLLVFGPPKDGYSPAYPFTSHPLD